MLKPSFISLCLALSCECFAEFNIPGIASKQLSPLAMNDKTLAQTGLTINEDDITPEQNNISLSDEHMHESHVWGLTLDEEKRYLQLMQNKNKIYYQGLNLTPIDILGINARNEMERNHFALLAAQQEAQKVSKNLAWNHAFHEAYNRLFKDIPVIGDFDPTPYAPKEHQPIALESGDNLYLFIKPHNAVKTILMTLDDLIAKTPNTRLHIMLLKTNDLGIQLWANAHQIPQAMVTQGFISLNLGDLNFEALNLKKKKTPLLIMVRHGSSQQVDLGRF